MKFKRMIFVSIFLLAILAIGAVSASDSQDLDNLTADNPTSLNVESLSLSEDETLSDGYEFYEDNYEVIFSESVNVDDDESRLISYDFYDDVEGSVAVTINGSEVYNGAPGSNEIYLSDLNADKFDYGTYKVDFIYSGDENNEGFIKSADVDFTYNFKVNAENNPVSYGNDAEFYVTVPSSSGSIEYVVNGKKYTVNAEDSYLIVVSSDDLKMGKNNITFTYVSDNYPVKTIDCPINVKGLVEVSKYEIAYDEVTYLTLKLPSDAKGDLNIYKIDDFEWDDDISYGSVFTLIKTVKVENGLVNASLDDLSFGYNYIYANYTGEDYEISIGDEYDQYIIVRVGPKVVFPDKMWNKGVYDCELIIPNSSNGTLYVEVDDNETSYSVVNGNGKFSIDASKISYDEFYLKYEGDDGFYYSHYFDVKITDMSPETKLEIDERDYQVLVKGSQEYHASFNIDLDYDAGGNITAYVDDVFYGVFNKSFVYIETGNLTFGKHDVRFEYSGDGYFAPSTAYDSFNVTYIDIYIPVDVFLSGDFQTISTALVTLPSDATGEVKLIVDGDEIESKKIEDGKAYFNLATLSYGNHTVSVVYENGNYNPSAKTVNVSAEYRYSLELYNLIYGDGETSVYLPDDAAGEVKVIINGNEFTENVQDGEAVFHITGIPAGNYTSTVIYSGDEKYPGKTVEFNTTVSYAIIHNFDEYRDVFIGDVDDLYLTLYLPEDAEGNLTIYLKDWDSEIEDYTYKQVAASGFIGGKAQIALGEFSDEIISDGSFVAKYEGEDYNVGDHDFILSLKNYDIIGPEDPEHIILGEDFTYQIRVPKDARGYIRVYNNTYKDEGKVILERVAIQNGVATIPLKYDVLGRHFIKILYVGNDYEIEEYGVCVVWPNNVTLASIAGGDEAVFTVVMPEDASGNVSITFDDLFSDDIRNMTIPYTGTAVFKASDIPVGYWALDHFEVSSDKYGEFYFYSTSWWIATGFYDYFEIVGSKIIPVDPGLTVSVDDIDAGEAAVVKIALNETINGYVLLSVGGSNYTVLIENGVGSQSVSGLVAGTYDAVVYYSGSEYFTASEKSASFKVNVVPIDPALSVVVDDIDAGEAAVVKIALNESISGSVLLSVGGSNYTVLIENGVGSQSVSGLVVGTYDAVVYYQGSEYFTESQKTVSFKVNEVKTPSGNESGNVTPSGNESGNVTPSGNESGNTTPEIVVEPKVVASNANVIYSAGSYYTIKVYGTDGQLASCVKVVIKVNGKTFYTLPTINGTVKFKVTQLPGKYKVQATALGKSATKTLTVKHIVTLKSVTVKRSAKNLILTATLSKVNKKYLKNKKITFKFNNKKYTAKTNSKGVAKVTIKSNVLNKLKVGKKVTYQATYLKDTVKKTVKVKK